MNLEWGSFIHKIHYSLLPLPKHPPSIGCDNEEMYALSS